MKFINSLLFVFIFSNINIHVAAQKVLNANDTKNLGFYSTDSSTVVGVRLVDQGDYLNSQYCAILKNKTVIKKTPYEVKVYGFDKRNNFYSKEIIIDGKPVQVFLERLSAGKISLYHYAGMQKELYFIETDSTHFYELPKSNKEKNDYRKTIADLTNECTGAAEASKLLTYRKVILTEYINHYNKNKMLPFPQIKIGAVAVFRSSDIIFKDNSLKALEYGISSLEDTGYKLGLFADIPISASNYSCHAEILYSDYNFSYGTQLFEYSIVYKTVQIPLIFQYAIPTQRIRGFFNLGPIYSHNFDFENTILQSDLNNNMESVPTNGNTFPNNHFGFTIGGGAQVKLDYKRWLLLEIGKSYLYSVNSQAKTKIQDLYLKVGLNF